MSLVRFEIRFNKPDATYFNGQHVTGDVVLELLKEKTFRGIELFFRGKTNVRWSEKHGDRTTTYYAREDYIKNSINLAGGQSTDTTLPPGIHIYPFRLILPISIPSSYESIVGHVRYTARAVISRPWRFDHKCKAAFTVLNPLDLNSEPNVSEPIDMTTEKKLWFGLGSPITVSVSVPFTGYVPGQICGGTCEIDNPTGNGLSVKARLVQVVTYTATCKRKKVVSNVVCREKLGDVNPQGSMKSSFNLQVPALPDSYLNHSSYIDISYHFEIKGSISGMHRSIHAKVPVVIGSIPLRTQFVYMTLWESKCPLSQTEDKNSNVLKKMELDFQETFSEACAMPDPFFQYPDMPPPSYEECVNGKINIEKEDDEENVPGVLDFAPRYPVYSFKEKEF